MELLIYILTVIWVFGFIAFFIYLYKVNSKPHLSEFLELTYDKVPSPLNPAELSMLLYKKIVPSVFTASLLVLIKKGIVTIEQKEDDIIFFRMGNVAMSPSQKELLTILFEEIGTGDAVTFQAINRFCRKQEHCTDFLLAYQIWRKEAYREIRYKFYEDKKGYGSIKFYRNIGLSLIVLNFVLRVHFIPTYCLILPIYFLHFYFNKIFKRRAKANTEYYKWLAYKNYLTGKEKLNEEEASYASIYGVIMGLSSILDGKMPGKNQHFIFQLEAVLAKSVRNASLNGNRSIRLWKS